MTRTDPTKIGSPSPKDVYINLEDKLLTVDGKASVIPAAPSANGIYYLKCVKDSSGATYSWATFPDVFPETPNTDGAYILTRTIAEGSATDSWESAGE